MVLVLPGRGSDDWLTVFDNCFGSSVGSGRPSIVAAMRSLYNKAASYNNNSDSNSNNNKKDDSRG